MTKQKWTFGRKLILCAAILLIAGLVLIGSLRHESSRSPSNVQSVQPQNDGVNSSFSQKPPLEKMLADLNAGHTVDDDDITVARFRSLLDQLSQHFPESRDIIADMTCKAREVLTKDGISESLLKIMEGLNQASQSAQSKGRQYAEYAAAYSSLRNQGVSHEETVDALFKAMMLVPHK